MRFAHWISAAAFFFLVVGVAVAQGPMQTAQDFEGTYQATTTADEGRAMVGEKIGDVVDQMPFYKKPFARERLKDTTKPCQTLDFSVRGQSLAIACDERPLALAPLSGEQSLYTNEKGEKFALVMKAGQNQVVQVFASEDGRRTNRYTLSEDGSTVTMVTTMESDQLPEPLVFEREFKRAG